MLSDRHPFAYVVEVDGRQLVLNVHDRHRGRLASTRGALSPVLQINAVFGIRHGTVLLVAETVELRFHESKQAHLQGVGTSIAHDEPLRQLSARILGRLSPAGNTGGLEFSSGGLESPALGAEAVPLHLDELQIVTSYRGEDHVVVGQSIEPVTDVSVRMNDLFSRHVVVTGSTGQGKSCLTAAVLQSLLTGSFPEMRCVIFDVNGEYERAFSETDAEHTEERRLREGVKLTRLGSDTGGGTESDTAYQIPYQALGPSGLEALLMPSDRAQKPALRFAMSALPFVRWVNEGVATEKDSPPVLFDDCRPGGANRAKDGLDGLRQVIHEEGSSYASTWPPMRALGPLVAEVAALQPDSRRSGGWKRDSFPYGHVSTLIRRIQTRVEDIAFKNVIDVEGGQEVRTDAPFRAATTDLLDRIFGLGPSPGSWQVHIVDLRLVAQDLLPFVLGGMIQSLLDELFRRGPGTIPPRLLVLEEAHHYLRRFSGDPDDSGLRDLLAYERLAKEGRKFGVGLWVSTQRLSEVSPTVLAQCGTWFCLRLTTKADLDRARSAAEWSGSSLFARIPDLPRQEAVAFGSALPIPVHIRLPTADPTPDSHDPPFWDRWKGLPEGRLTADKTEKS